MVRNEAEKHNIERLAPWITQQSHKTYDKDPELGMNDDERNNLIRLVIKAIQYYRKNGGGEWYYNNHLFWLNHQIGFNVRSDADRLICRHFVFEEYMRRMGSEHQHRQSLLHYLKLSGRDYNDYNNDNNICVPAISILLRGSKSPSTKLLGGVCKRLATVCMDHEGPDE